MTSNFNKFIFTSGNNNQELNNLYKYNENQVQPLIKYLPTNINYQSTLNSPVYQNIYSDYNPHSPSIKSPNLYFPKVIDYEISFDDNYYSNNNINIYKHYSKSPNNKNINPINFYYASLSNKKENKNKARSPEILRSNYLDLSNNINKNINGYNELMLKEGSVSKIISRSPSPLVEKQNYINKIKYTQNQQYNGNNNNLNKKIISNSPSKINDILSTSLRSKNQIEYNENNYNYSTKYSRSPKSNMNKDINKRGVITNFLEKPISKINDLNNLQNFTSNSNSKNYEFLIDKPLKNNFESIFENDKNNNNRNKTNNNNEINEKNNKIDFQSPLKTYKSIFPNSNINSYKTNLNKDYIKNFDLSSNQKKLKNFTNKKGYDIHTLYQYLYEKSLTPKDL